MDQEVIHVHMEFEIFGEEELIYSLYIESKEESPDLSSVDHKHLRDGQRKRIKGRN